MKRKRSDSDPDLTCEPHLRAHAPIPPTADQGIEHEPTQPRPGDAADPEHALVDEPALAWAGLNREAHPGYREHLARQRAGTPVVQRWAVVCLAALAAGPWAVLGAFYKSLLGEGGWGVMAVVIVGPAIEEIMKIALLYWLVERKPWLLPGTAAIVGVGVVAGMSFGIIENLLYLHVYFPDAGPRLAVWRWSVTMPMHAVCSLLAAVGVATMWRRVWATGRPADVAAAFPWLVTAMVIHGVYNAFAVGLSVLGLEPG